MKSTISVTLISILIAVSTMVGCTKKEAEALSFSKDIKPILAANCLECHASGGQGHGASGLSMETHADLMKGTKFGPIVKPGDSLSSTMVVLIEGRADASINMPHGERKSLTPEQVKSIKDWIDQGALDN